MKNNKSDYNKFTENIERAVNILKNGGCSAVYLFGSGARRDLNEYSDIDLAIKGCPTGKFFNLYGKLMMTLDFPVDLVDMDHQTSFTRFLEKQGEMVQVG